MQSRSGGGAWNQCEGKMCASQMVPVETSFHRVSGHTAMPKSPWLFSGSGVASIQSVLSAQVCDLVLLRGLYYRQTYLKKIKSDYQSHRVLSLLFGVWWCSTDEGIRQRNTADIWACVLELEVKFTGRLGNFELCRPTDLDCCSRVGLCPRQGCFSSWSLCQKIKNLAFSNDRFILIMSVFVTGNECLHLSETESMSLCT